MAVSDNEPGGKRKIKSKAETNGEEGQSNRKAKSMKHKHKHKRLKRKIKMEDGCSEGNREKRDRKVSRKIKFRSRDGCSEGNREKRGRKVSRKKRINDSDCPIAKQKLTPTLLEPPLSVSNPRTIKWAELALVHYATKQGAEFKVLDVVAECCRFLACYTDIPMGWYCHLFFKAVPRDDNRADVSPKTFFAEINTCGGEEVYVLTCCIIDPDDPGKKLGCGICPAFEDLPHPNTGFIAGCFPYEEPCVGDDYP